MRRLKQLRTYEVALDKAGLGPVAGVDEAGRGACFGPVTIAACVLPIKPIAALEGLTDSKKLSAKKRELLFDEIRNVAVSYHVIHIPAAEIDRRGIQHANLDGARMGPGAPSQAWMSIRVTCSWTRFVCRGFAHRNCQLSAVTTPRVVSLRRVCWQR